MYEVFGSDRQHDVRRSAVMFSHDEQTPRLSNPGHVQFPEGHEKSGSRGTENPLAIAAARSRYAGVPLNEKLRVSALSQSQAYGK